MHDAELRPQRPCPETHPPPTGKVHPSRSGLCCVLSWARAEAWRVGSHPHRWVVVQRPKPLGPWLWENEQVALAHRDPLPPGRGVADSLVLLHEGAFATFLGVQVVHVQVPVRGTHQQSGNLLDSSEDKKQPSSRSETSTKFLLN